MTGLIATKPNILEETKNMKQNIFRFMKKNAKIINNVGILVVVLLAVYVKMNDEDASVAFKLDDVYIIAGIFLAFCFLHFIRSRRKK